MDRVEPDAVNAEPLEVVQLRSQPGEVADTVTVPVGERPGIDLIEDAFAPPWISHGVHLRMSSKS